MSESQVIHPFIFQGWNPPEPILQPQNWAVPASDQPVLVSIDFYAVVGGPYRSAVDRWLKNGWPVLWQVTEAMEKSDVLIDAVSKAVESIQAVALDADALEIETVSRESEWGIWARVFLPETFALLGESKFADLLQRLQSEIPQVAELPWLSLGYLSGFVRQISQKQSWDYSSSQYQTVTDRADYLSEKIAVEWGRYQALYSPMNEESESASLSGTQMMINPAAQILPLRLQSEVLVIVRRRRPQWGLSEIRLRSLDALLIDELSEQGRMTRTELLQRVRVEHPITQGPNGLWINGLKLEHEETFDARLDHLIENGVILVQVN